MTTKQKNKWKDRTIALTLICVIILASMFIETFIVQKQETPTDLELCQATTGVPAFVSIINKEVLFSGNHGVPEPGVIDSLINEEIVFVYSSGCPHCRNQIEAFGEEWIKYQESGLTVDCASL